MFSIVDRAFWVDVSQQTAGDCDSFATANGVNIPPESSVWFTGEPDNCSNAMADPACVLLGNFGFYSDLPGQICSNVVFIPLCELV